MNLVYRSIWNEKAGTFVAASENTKSGGNSSLGQTTAARGVCFALKALTVSLLLAFGAGAWALPTGGVVSAGSASISGGPGQMTINQSSQKAAINWQGFSIGQGEAVRFAQPNSSSVALNRVLGSDPSSILGSLSANGKVFLVNPHGILFGQGAQVNVGGLVASSLNITDANFMAGRYNFSGPGTGAILNQGTINADGGYVALLGANVSNEGVISARLGTVALAAGKAMTLDMAGDGLLHVGVSEGAVNSLVHNSGLLRADGGQVLLTTQTAGTLLQGAVNNTGVIQAQSVENRNGLIRLTGDMQSGTLNVGGTLDASGTGTGQTGGNVILTGHHVGLFGANINASGDAGGGTVLIGGGFQGKNPAVQNASATYMSADSTITADAITNGNGGTVVLWADDSTRAYGSISARGGSRGGDGGLIETSGHWLDVLGISVNASAPNGERGMWLLDPADVTISTGATTNGSFTGGVFTPNPGANTANVDVATIVGNAGSGLTGGTNITILTANNGSGNGDITVANDIVWTRVTPGPASTLTLNATRDTNINAPITATFGNLVVCCGRDINVNAAITTTDGSIFLGAGRDIRQNAAITTTRGNITMCAGHDVLVSGKIVLTDFANFQGLASARNTGLGLADGLVLSAGNAATGPGAAGGGGTVVIAPRADPAEITRAPVTIIYNANSYLPGGQTDFSTGVSFANPGDPHTQFMLVFPGVVDKVADGTTTATLSGFQTNAISGPVPGTVSLNAGPFAAANFDNADIGAAKTVTFSGFSLSQNPILTGGTASNFALPVACCAPFVGLTRGNIIPEIIVVPVPPVVVALVEVAPDVVAPVVVAPGIVAPSIVAPVVVVPDIVAPIVVAPGVVALVPAPVVAAPELGVVEGLVGAIGEVIGGAIQGLFGLVPGDTLASSPSIRSSPLNLTVESTGVRMPEAQFAQAPLVVPPPVMLQPVPVVPPVPAMAPPVVVPTPPFVPPPPSPRRDRN